MSAAFSAGAIKDQPPHTPLDAQAAAFYALFIDLAYEMFANNPRTKQPTAPPKLRDLGYDLTAWIVMSDFAVFGETIKKFYGFIATEIDDPYSHIIALRGTKGWWEWYDDAFVYPRRFDPVPSAGRVHYGFYRIYHTMRVYRAPHPHEPRALPTPVAPGGTFAEQVEQLVPLIAHPEGQEETGRDHHFVVTGHSLGAALCTLYVMHHAIRKKQAREGARERRVVIERVCTFGSPRVGMRVFTDQYRALPIDSWRLANAYDLVSKVPPRFPFPYLHVEDSYLFTSEGVVVPGFKPSCWHAMRTYEHWLDPRVPLNQRCSATGA
jgi:hypothetical protein